MKRYKKLTLLFFLQVIVFTYLCYIYFTKKYTIKYVINENGFEIKRIANKELSIDTFFIESNEIGKNQLCKRYELDEADILRDANKYYNLSSINVETKFKYCENVTNETRLVTIEDLDIYKSDKKLNMDLFEILILQNLTNNTNDNNTDYFYVKLDFDYFKNTYNDTINLTCTFNLYDKVYKKSELNRKIEILETKVFAIENNYGLYLNKNGFYFVDCSRNGQLLYYDNFILYPKDIRKLVRTRNMYKVKENDLDKKQEVSKYLKSKNRKKIRNPMKLNGKMNVLFFKFDSIARRHFPRAFPATYKYLTEEMSDNILFDDLNSVGSNSYPNMLPLITGIIVDALNEYNLSSEIDKYRDMEKGFFDKLPYIWNDYEREGYVTMYQEDLPTICQFNYNKPGFKGKPTTFYSRPYWTEHYKKRNKLQKCINGIPTYKKYFDIMETFVERMNNNINKDMPYISFNFHSEYTHNDFAIPLNMDNSFKNIIERFEINGYLDNTLLIIFSDHGNRLTSYGMYTASGKAEKYRPFLSIKLPKVLMESKFGKNAEKNSDKLISMYDLYQTLRHFLALNNKDHIYENEHNLNIHELRRFRGISLFEEIPLNRSCFDAMIPYAQCTCGKSVAITVDQFNQQTGISIDAIKRILLDEVVNKTSSNRDKCITYEFDSIFSIKKKIFQNDYIFSFEYLLQPGNAMFDVALLFNNYNNFNNFNYTIIGKIIRTSLYSDQSHCITDIDIKNYCYCNDLV